MNKIQNIKVLFWDIDNTLLDFDAGAEDSMKQAFSDLGLEYIKTAGIKSRWCGNGACVPKLSS